MAYSSLSSILLVLPGLPQTSTSAGYSTTAAVVGRHITRADALIDSKIARRYSVPISPTPPLIGSLSEDITAYYSYRSFYTQDNSNRNEYFEELRANALSTLDEIRDGKLDLVNTSGSLISERSTEATSGVLDSTNKDYQPFFDVDDELNWKFDADLIDAVGDKR
jgi:phage gp36-like protein